MKHEKGSFTHIQLRTARPGNIRLRSPKLSIIVAAANNDVDAARDKVPTYEYWQPTYLISSAIVNGKHGLLLSVHQSEACRFSCVSIPTPWLTDARAGVFLEDPDANNLNAGRGFTTRCA